MRGWLVFGPLLCCSARIDEVNVGAIPSPPDAAATTDTIVTTFALNALFLGDTARDGKRAVNTINLNWTAFGYDIDHRVTIAQSPDVCTLESGSSATQIDGNDGIDNSFGANLLPLIQYGTGAENLTGDATSLIASGAWTLQIRVTGLSGDSLQSATGLSADTFVSGAYGSSPAFDSTTSWPARPSTRVRFDIVYVNAGTVVMRDAEQPLTLPIQLLNYYYSDPKPPVAATLTLHIRVPVITLQLGDGGVATNGTIAGVLETQEAVDSEVAFANALGSCNSPFDSEVIGARDILADGTNAPDTPCNAISIGLGFTAKQVANPPESGVDPPPDPNACNDAGTAGDVDAQ